MTSPTKTPSAKPLSPLSQQQVTDVFHTIIQSHMQTVHSKPGSAFGTTQTQRNAELMQALQRSQRNL